MNFVPDLEQGINKFSIPTLDGTVTPEKTKGRRAVKIRDSALQDLQKLIIPNEVILQAITNHVALDCLEDARSIYEEAGKGDKVAQFIVGISLQKAGRRDAAEVWLNLSAKQGFGPAKLHLEEAS